MEKQFDLGDVLTVATGNLISPRGMEGVYDICNFLSGESVYTHQIPRVIREARPMVLSMHPQLANADVSGITPENFKARLAELKAAYGETLAVRKMTKDEHERIDPLSELAEKIHPDKIVVVRAD